MFPLYLLISSFQSFLLTFPHLAKYQPFLLTFPHLAKYSQAKPEQNNKNRCSRIETHYKSPPFVNQFICRHQFCDFEGDVRPITSADCVEGCLAVFRWTRRNRGHHQVDQSDSTGIWMWFLSGLVICCRVIWYHCSRWSSKCLFVSVNVVLVLIVETFYGRGDEIGKTEIFTNTKFPRCWRCGNFLAKRSHSVVGKLRNSTKLWALNQI